MFSLTDAKPRADRLPKRNWTTCHFGERNCPCAPNTSALLILMPQTTSTWGNRFCVARWTQLQSLWKTKEDPQEDTVEFSGKPDAPKALNRHEGLLLLITEWVVTLTSTICLYWSWVCCVLEDTLNREAAGRPDGPQHNRLIKGKSGYGDRSSGAPDHANDMPMTQQPQRLLWLQERHRADVQQRDIKPQTTGV